MTNAAHSAGEAGKLIGTLHLEVRDRSGKLKPLWNENALGKFIRRSFGLDLQSWFFLGHFDDNMHFKNLVVSAGKAGVASRINGSGAEAVFVYLAVGTGTNAAAAGDTALQTEITGSGLDRVSATASRITTSVTNDTAKLTTTFSVSGTKAITEEGILNAASTGTLLARQVFSAVNVVSGDTFSVTHTLAVS